MLSNVQVDLFETCEDSLLCSLWREKTQKNSFLPDMLEVHAQKNKIEICLICFDGHGPQKKDVVIYDQSILFAQKTHPSKHQHHVFSTSKSHRFQAPPNPPTPPSAPAPLAAPRPQRGRGGARSQPHPGSQRLHHPCPGGRLAQHPVPRDGSSTTSPGPE